MSRSQTIIPDYGKPTRINHSIFSLNSRPQSRACLSCTREPSFVSQQKGTQFVTPILSLALLDRNHKKTQKTPALRSRLSLFFILAIFFSVLYRLCPRFQFFFRLFCSHFLHGDASEGCCFLQLLVGGHFLGHVKFASQAFRHFITCSNKKPICRSYAGTMIGSV